MTVVEHPNVVKHRTLRRRYFKKKKKRKGDVKKKVFQTENNIERQITNLYQFVHIHAKICPLSSPTKMKSRNVAIALPKIIKIPTTFLNIQKK